MGSPEQPKRWFKFPWMRAWSDRKAPEPVEGERASIAPESIAPESIAPDWKRERLALLGAHAAAWLSASSSDAFLPLDEYVRGHRIQWQLRTADRVPPLPPIGRSQVPLEENAAVPADAMPSDAIRPDRPLFMLGLCAMHPDGRVRERAVRALAQLANPQAIPFLLLRTADWVAQVSHPAREAIALLLASDAAPFARSAALIAGLSDIRRSDQA